MFHECVDDVLKSLYRFLMGRRNLHIKLRYGKALKQNKPIPQWVRMKSENKNKLRYNYKRRHWRRTKCKY